MEMNFKEWLSTGEAQTLIRRVAHSVLRTVRERRYSLNFIGMEAGTTLADGYLLEEIESELMHFLLENRRGIQEKLKVSGFKGGQILRYAFLQDWLDSTRNRQSDPWRYLYKRTVDTMRSSTDFKARRGDKGSYGGTFYSMALESLSIQEPTDQDLSSITLPDTLLSSRTFEALNKGDVLLALAMYFWHELSVRSGGNPIWVPVKTFINWIASHVCLESGQRIKAGPNKTDLLDQMADDSHKMDAICFDPEKILRWVGNFACSLTKEESMAFSMHLGEGLTLEKVAEKLGYRGPSGPSYLILKTKDKLRRFLRDLPWLSPPDLNEEAWGLFTEALFSALKKHQIKP